MKQTTSTKRIDTEIAPVGAVIRLSIAQSIAILGGAVVVSLYAGCNFKALQSSITKPSSSFEPSNDGESATVQARFPRLDSSLGNWQIHSNRGLFVENGPSSRRELGEALTSDDGYQLVKRDNGERVNEDDAEDDASDSEDDSSDDEEEDSIDSALAQHLFADVKGVDPKFLESSAQVERAMGQFASELESRMTDLQCYQSQQTGSVSCVGATREARLSVYTWPSMGWLMLDLFVGDADPLMPLVQAVDRLFAVASSSHDETQPFVQWAQKNRGLNALENAEEVEVDRFLLGPIKGYAMRSHVASVQTAFQTIDVFEALSPRKRNVDKYLNEVDANGRVQDPLVAPDRIVYLDNVMQSRLHGEAAYHEALVHPALFAHKNPKRVAIIGGGEGATLREILKHKTVETVTMIEIDEQMVNASREHLPQWSDCSTLVGSADNCFDDPRTELYCEDAIAWFINRFSTSMDAGIESERYDVIIMDALDPSSVVAFSDILYGDRTFVGSMCSALNEDGVFIAQVGEDDSLNEPGEEFLLGTSIMPLVNLLVDGGFTFLTDYSEVHGNFIGGPWSYLIGFKDDATKQNWLSNEADYQLRLHQRVLPTHGGDSSLRYFDGATQMTYAYPSKITEITFCRTEPKPEFCELGRDRGVFVAAESMVEANDTFAWQGTGAANDTVSGQESESPSVQVTDLMGSMRRQGMSSFEGGSCPQSHAYDDKMAEGGSLSTCTTGDKSFNTTETAQVMLSRTTFLQHLERSTQKPVKSHPYNPFVERHPALRAASN